MMAHVVPGWTGNLGLFARRGFGYVRGPAAMQTPVNAFSVDVEDWYQVADFDAVVPFERWGDYESRVRRNTDKILNMLEEFGVKGTFFILTWNAERWPEIVREIHAAGHEIASHGYAHRIVYEQTREQFAADVARAKKTLEDITGDAVLGYRAPSFSRMTYGKRSASGIP